MLVTLTVALRVSQSSEPGAGHIFHLAHVHHDPLLAAATGRLQCLSQLCRFHTVYPTGNRDQVSMLELLGCDFHRSSSSTVTFSLSTRQTGINLTIAL